LIFLIFFKPDNNKYYDIAFEQLKIIIEIQEYNNHTNNNNDNNKLIYINAHGYIVLYLKIDQFKEHIKDCYHNFTTILFECIINRLISLDISICSDYLVYCFENYLINIINEMENEIINIKNILNTKYYNIDYNDISKLNLLLNHINDENTKYLIEKYINFYEDINEHKNILEKLNDNTSSIYNLFKIKYLSYKNNNKKNNRIDNKNISSDIICDLLNLDNTCRINLENKFRTSRSIFIDNKYYISWSNLNYIIQKNEILSDEIKSTLILYLSYIEDIVLAIMDDLIMFNNNIIKYILKCVDEYKINIQKTIYEQFEYKIDSLNNEINKLNNDLSNLNNINNGLYKSINKIINLYDNDEIYDSKSIKMFDNIKNSLNLIYNKKKNILNNINLDIDNQSILPDIPNFIIYFSSNINDTIKYEEYISIMNTYNIHSYIYNTILDKLCNTKKPKYISFLKIVDSVSNIFYNDNSNNFNNYNSNIDKININDLINNLNIININNNNNNNFDNNNDDNFDNNNDDNFDNNNDDDDDF